jgi:hypothetical protein
MIIVWKINPYEKSLNIHKYGLLYNQTIYFFFLLFVNFINYFDTIPEIVSLVFVYFILSLCLILVVLTIVRLFYEYKYGEKLENEVQKKR